MNNPELEARILANPDDLTSYLVYGDWLSERGDPRGELIAVHAKLEASPNDAALAARAAEIIEANGEAWLGALRELEDLKLEWRLGFLSKVTIGPTDDYATTDTPFDVAIGALMAVPGCALVRSITFGSKSADDLVAIWSDAIDALGEHGVPAGLRELAFDRGGYWDISSTELGDLSPLYPKLARLERLRVEIGSMELGKPMNLPSLRALHIKTGGLSSDNVAAIAGAAWPNLEDLELWTGESGNDYGCNVELADLRALVDAASAWPKLERLAIANSSLADDVAQLLLKSKILPRLRRLSIARGTLGDEGGRAILESAEAFAHLEQLDLSGHWMSVALSEALKKKFGDRVLVEETEGPAADRDDRYCQLGE